METTTISSTYQVEIPKSVRDKLQLVPGQKLEAIVYEGRLQLVPLRPISEMRGAFPGLDTRVPRDKDRL